MAKKKYNSAEEAMEARRAQAREYYWRHRDERIAYQRALDPAIKNARSLEYRKQLRAEIIGHYGARCVCCGETETAFLTMDHKDGGGYRHRQSLNANWLAGGLSVLLDIRKRGFPPEFQVLCWNCNNGRAKNGGICPHKE